MIIKKLQRFESNGLPLVYWAVKKLKLESILEKYIPSHGSEKIPAAKSLMLILYNLTLGRLPLYELEEWCSKINPKSIGETNIPTEILNDDRFGRSLDKLYDTDRSSLLTEIVSCAVQRFDIDLDVIHNDSTTAKAHGDIAGQTKDGLEFKHGKSKDHRADLKQLLFCLSITADGGVPVHYKAYPGNTTDDKTHIETWKIIKGIKGSSDFLYVADCKVCTQEQLGYIVDHGGKVITIMPSTWKEVTRFKNELRVKNIAKEKILEKVIPAHRFTGIPEDKAKHERFYAFSGDYRTDDGYKIHWIYSSEKKKRDLKQREDFLKKTEQMLSVLNSKLNIRKYKVKDIIEEAVDQILKKNKTEQFFDIKISSKNITTEVQLNKGRPGPNTSKKNITKAHYSLTWSRNINALKKEKNVDGIFPLLSTDDTYTPLAALEHYKYQPRLEKRFTQLKSFHKIMPILFKKIERVEAIMFLFFIGMMIQAIIEREVRNNMEKANINHLNIYPEEREAFRPTTPIMLELFEGISTSFIIDGETNTEEFRDDLSKNQVQLLSMLGQEISDYWEP